MVSPSVAAQTPPTNSARARELPRRRAVAVGLLAETTGERAVIDQAIEDLLAREVVPPKPTDEECRRYYDAHHAAFESSDLVHVRPTLFQATPGVSIPEIRARAERTLNDLLRKPERFGDVAVELSNCPSGQHGGNLGQIGRGETAPEFERAIFRLAPTGLLPELVRTRHVFHIVAIDRRIPGRRLPFEMVKDEVAERLEAAVEEKALRQYVSVLAGRADIQGPISTP